MAVSSSSRGRRSRTRRSRAAGLERSSAPLVRAQRDVDLAGRQALDDDHAGELAGRQRGVGRGAVLGSARRCTASATSRRSTPTGGTLRTRSATAMARCREGGIVRDDDDPGHRLAIDVTDRDRREGDEHREAHEHDRGGEEERAADAVAVLAPGDDPGVREERIAAGHQAAPPAVQRRRRGIGRERRRRRRPGGRRAR